PSVVPLGKLDVDDLPCLEAVQPAIEQELLPGHLYGLPGPVLQRSPATPGSHLAGGTIPLFTGVSPASDDVRDQILKVYTVLHGLIGRGGFPEKSFQEIPQGVLVARGVIVGVVLQCVEPGG